ncbi:MAG TPA: alpha/beta hydrolase family protein [Acidimicrobiales bacterium]|nr:alpha/beta hydrolase family protein [Acidimicrobiales bacterium]
MKLGELAGRARRALERPADPPDGVSLWSPANRRRIEHWVWTPPGATGDLPLVLMLHGTVDATGHVMWQHGRAKETAALLVREKVVPPFALVLGTDTGHELGSAYADWHDGSARVETYVLDELLGWADSALPLNGVRHVAGISMGGYGALTLALRRPGRFESASSTSGYFDPMRLFGSGRVPDFSDRVWGDADRRAAHDPRTLVADPARRANLRVAFDCGTEDDLIADNRAFHQHLTDLEIPHGYAEHPGSHDWTYWRTHLADHFRFHLTNTGPLAIA